jgi:hypothetical protein
LSWALERCHSEPDDNLERTLSRRARPGHCARQTWSGRSCGRGTWPPTPCRGPGRQGQAT